MAAQLLTHRSGGRSARRTAEHIAAYATMPLVARTRPGSTLPRVCQAVGVTLRQHVNHGSYENSNRSPTSRPGNSNNPTATDRISEHDDRSRRQGLGTA